MEVQRERVLVVDDDDSIRWLVASALGGEGYVVRWASGGEAALAIMEEWRPALLVLDLMMPVMDGFEVLAEVRARWPEPAVPVLVLSAYAEGEARARAGGADEFVKKPFQLTELVARVRAVLSRRSP